MIGSSLFICPIQNVMHNKLSDWGNRTFDLPANFCNILSFKCQQNWITFINVIFSHQINCASVINNCQCLSQRLLCHLQLFHNKNEKNISNDKNKSLRLTEKKFLYNSFFLTVTSCQLKSTLIWALKSLFLMAGQSLNIRMSTEVRYGVTHRCYELFFTCQNHVIEVQYMSHHYRNLSFFKVRMRRREGEKIKGGCWKKNIFSKFSLENRTSKNNIF